jgi:diguanylate cyclase (GGDEF)-like protein
LKTENNSLDTISISKLQNKNMIFNRYFIDHMTNLPNVYQLRRDLEDKKEFTLIMFNVDNFRTINNFYGCMVGDYVIEKIGQHFKDNFKDLKTYRLSGDEFGFVIEKKMFFYDIKKYLVHLCEDMKDFVVKYKDDNIYIDFTLASSSSKGYYNIFSKVSMALRHAKEAGLNFWIYEDKMNFEEDYAIKMQLSQTVREALKNHRVIPYYQAIIDTKTSKIQKYECLARLIDSEGNIVSPILFIPVAKKIKHYNMVTKIIIEKAFEYFENMGYEFTINLSIEDIVKKEMFEFIMDKLKMSSISDKVTFEILESDAIEDFNKVDIFIEEVRRYGSKIAIDDFGSGYSNFSYLTKIKADYIKIDGSLIQNIDTDKNSLIVVEAIVQFAQKLGIKTIAEYVSSKAILEKVKELNIDYAQGFYISEPSMFGKISESI